jgi:hypothetical protein
MSNYINNMLNTLNGILNDTNSNHQHHVDQHQAALANQQNQSNLYGIQAQTLGSAHQHTLNHIAEHSHALNSAGYQFMDGSVISYSIPLNNVFIGYSAGIASMTGSNNVFIGSGIQWNVMPNLVIKKRKPKLNLPEWF